MATTFLSIGTGVAASGAGSSTVNLGTLFNFTGAATPSVDYQLFNANSPAEVQVLALTSGANTINATNCPAIATAGGVWLIPPSGNGQTITLKGISADTGIALNLTAPTFLPFPLTPPTSFIITTNGAISGFKLAWV